VGRYVHSFKGSDKNAPARIISFVSYSAFRKAGLVHAFCLPGRRENMDITEGRPYQGLSSQLASRWRRFVQAWPLFVVILGVVLSFGWTAMLIWVVWGLIDLTT
jgi:hypothetical protein